jgi:hypothetical protein
MQHSSVGCSIALQDYLYFLADEYEAAKRPVWRRNTPKKTGARSARARTRGQNPLVEQNTTHHCCNEGYVCRLSPDIMFSMKAMLNSALSSQLGKN